MFNSNWCHITTRDLLSNDGEAFRLAVEAQRIRRAHLCDPLLAVSMSLVDPLPHQLTAVYEELLPRQPLRYLLADDPGAGKTIMAGLFTKELHIRGDVQHCLIVAPGALVAQWQTELALRFQLPFALIDAASVDVAAMPSTPTRPQFWIVRLDQLARNEAFQAQLCAVAWDLVIFDEAHKLAASFFGGEVRYTRRYRAAQRLGASTRHLLLLTATPHNGKEEDFQLFLALLDPDRFAGRFRDGVHTADVSDLMRRLTKEQLLTFEGRPLFPERIATTVPYALSAEEQELYEQVSHYVRQEFNRADALERGQRGTIGFALTMLQRRLASSPAAIFQSLHRRRKRLEQRLAEARLLGTGHSHDSPHPLLSFQQSTVPLDDEELDEANEYEFESPEAQFLDQATAARTIDELLRELALLADLEALAAQLCRSGTDKKWEQLRALVSELVIPTPATAGHQRPKLVVFTEHLATLHYLTERITTLLGRAEAVVSICGTMDRRERQAVEEAFAFDPAVQILVATDAAGEGINLQHAHLMVNYDLPWNPNRLEQRFGRIHRIGQTEVCHLWNLVAHETREGEVYARLLQKLEVERSALGGQVFDVLGRLSFQNRPLRDLLVEAVRYGDQPEVRARLSQTVETTLDREQLRALLQQRALAHASLDVAQVFALREDLERAEARRLQPYFIGAFFLTAFQQLGGRYYERERGRYELTYVPPLLRQPDAVGKSPVAQRYARVTFSKELRLVRGQPEAALLAPGHPLLEATLAALLARSGDLLQQGALLIDPADTSTLPRMLLIMEHRIQEARPLPNGEQRIVAQQLQCVEVDTTGAARPAGYAPHLDYRSATPSEQALLLAQSPAFDAHKLEATIHTLQASMAADHLATVRQRRDALVTKTLQAVQERLTKEIIYWNSQAVKYREQERAGKRPRMHALVAERRADELQERLRQRQAELEQERHVVASAPTLLARALIIPVGLITQWLGTATTSPDGSSPEARRRIELSAMALVMQSEQALGFQPRDVSGAKVGYDIESRIPATGQLRFIEVKGRSVGASTVTVSRNEILTALNKPDEFILALVAIPAPTAGGSPTLRYVRRPFTREPEAFAESVNYNWDDLWAMGEEIVDCRL
ncbi:helicase-related protein [Candidatus Viridilinea mediisalina]|uniref:RNA helicase n=1 Tax=Candidatus Viridilinea mediisalina TaxID=2024553 RepID=A0A2A6RM27_9CHLR|nr:helicase-related protein [Candidatus Viridilinea mediisalina]PDW04122.1 RNA helicase [Candidatus Viridilinea mediisalina]